MKARVLVALVSVVVLQACAPAPPPQSVPEGEKGNVAKIEPGDSELATATKKARETLDTFIVKSRDKAAYKMVAVKFPMPVQNKIEHIWMDVDAYREGVFTGSLANDSVYDPNVRVGQPMKVRREDVEDWMLIDGRDRIEGGYSVETVRKRAE